MQRKHLLHIPGWPARSCPIRLLIPPAAAGTAPKLGSFRHFAYAPTAPQIGFVSSPPLRPTTPARYVRVFRRGAYAARNPALSAFLPVPACPGRRHPLPEIRPRERTDPDRPRGSQSPHRRGQRLVSRRIEERAPRQDRLRPPLRTPHE